MNGTSVLVWTFLTDFIFNLHKYAELLEKKKFTLCSTTGNCVEHLININLAGFDLCHRSFLFITNLCNK